MPTSTDTLIIERDDFSTYCDLLWAYQAELLNPEVTGAKIKTRSKKDIFKILQEDIVLMAEYKMPAGVVIVNRYKTILEAQGTKNFTFSILHDDNITKTFGNVVFELDIDGISGDEDVILQNKVKMASYAELISKIEQTALQMEAITKGTYEKVEAELAVEDTTIQEQLLEDEAEDFSNVKNKYVRKRKRDIIKRIFTKLLDLFASLGRLLKRTVRLA